MRPPRRPLLVVLLVLAICGELPVGGASLAGPPATDEPSTPPDLTCAPGAITCVRITGHPSHGTLPVTFGMPFAPGEVPRGATLAAVAGGRDVPLQLDQPATYSDGSLRFVILSVAVPGTSGAVVSILPGPPPTGTPVAPAAWVRAGHDVSVALDLYSAQVSTVTLGNRRGHEPGTPFASGETITVRLGDDPADSFTIRVTEKTAGGAFGTLKLLSAELAGLIDASRRFQAYKIGEGGGWETLWVTTRGGAADARPFAVRAETSGQAPVRTDIVQPFEASRRYTAAASAALAERTARPWLAGPVAGETLLAGRFRADDGTVHPRLTARFNLRLHAGGGPARTDVIVEDLWTYDPAPRNWRYDVSIRQDGREVFSQKEVTHFHHARWHRLLWSEADPATMVQYERHHLLNSRAVQHYDERLAVSAATIAAQFAAMRRADTGIMGAAGVTPYFGTTGGRGDIGPLPQWTVLYLLSMDPRAYAVMLANADASGSIPIHYRDRATDHPVRLDDHPGIVTGAWPPGSGADKVPPVANGDTPWQPDAAHQPSLVYVPYMVTGDRYYLEEVQFWANWNLGIAAPGPRQGADGILVNSGQTRSAAWSLRALGEAAAISPDSDPMKRYFEAKLGNNIRYALSLADRRRNPLGLDAITTGNDRFAPWQLDFLILTVGQIAAAGYPGADRVLGWLAVPALGLWTNEPNGFCRNNAPSEWLVFREPGNGSMFTTWSELQRANFPQQAACPPGFPKDAYDGTAIGYVANAMAAAALLADHDMPAARTLFDALDRRSGAVRFAQNPTWRIVPRKR